MTNLKSFGIFLILPVAGLFYAFISAEGGSGRLIEVQTVQKLEGDWSFIEEWSYAENIFVNQQTGELICDGWCPEGVEGMRGKDGRIKADKRDEYYALVDTSHLFHSFKGEVVAYEYVGTNFAQCKKNGPNDFTVWTEANIGTHSSLIMEITGIVCKPKIHFNSVMNIPEKNFLSSGGWLKVCETELKKGYFRAEFEFKFTDPDREEPLSWKGKIHTKIQE